MCGARRPLVALCIILNEVQSLSAVSTHSVVTYGWAVGGGPDPRRRKRMTMPTRALGQCMQGARRRGTLASMHRRGAHDARGVESKE